MQTFILFYKEKRKDKYPKDKNCIKVKLGVIVVIEGNIEVLHVVLHISYVIKIPIVSYNESSYNYHFIIKGLEGELEKKLLV